MRSFRSRSEINRTDPARQIARWRPRDLHRPRARTRLPVSRMTTLEGREGVVNGGVAGRRRTVRRFCSPRPAVNIAYTEGLSTSSYSTNVDTVDARASVGATSNDSPRIQAPQRRIRLTRRRYASTPPPSTEGIRCGQPHTTAKRGGYPKVNLWPRRSASKPETSHGLSRWLAASAALRELQERGWQRAPRVVPTRRALSAGETSLLGQLPLLFVRCASDPSPGPQPSGACPIADTQRNWCGWSAGSWA